MDFKDGEAQGLMCLHICAFSIAGEARGRVAEWRQAKLGQAAIVTGGYFLQAIHASTGKKKRLR